MPPFVYERMILFMAAQYSYVPIQTVAPDENVIFNNNSFRCRKGYVSHRDDSGIFTARGSTNGCRALYKVSFHANIAISAGGTVEPISVSATYNGEEIRSTNSIVTPAAIGDFWSVNFQAIIDVDCGCCVSIAVENTSATTDIDVQNAEIIFERIA